MKEVKVLLVIPEQFEQATLRAVHESLNDIGERDDCGFNFWSIETETAVYNFDDELIPNSKLTDRKSMSDVIEQLEQERQIWLDLSKSEKHRTTKASMDGTIHGLSIALRIVKNNSDSTKL